MIRKDVAVDGSHCAESARLVWSTLGVVSILLYLSCITQPLYCSSTVEASQFYSCLDFLGCSKVHQTHLPMLTAR